MGTQLKKIIRALDIGYGACKLIRGIDRNGLAMTDSFPSIVARVDNPCHNGLMSKKDTCCININEQYYEAGKDMDAAFDGGSERTLHENYIGTDEYKVLLKTSLYYMDEKNIDLLVVGLPVDYMNNKSEELKKLIIGSHTVGDKTFNVKDIHIVPQPIGGFMSLVKSKNMPPELVRRQRNLLIDPGFFTVDYIAARGLKTINNISGSTPYGMHALLHKVCEHISKDFNISYNNISSVDEGLQNGQFALFGKKVDLKKYVKKSLSVFNPVIKELSNQIGDGREITNIILVGGGAIYLQPLIKKAFPNHQILLSDTPEKANVIGFQFIGELAMNDNAQGDQHAA